MNTPERYLCLLLLVLALSGCASYMVYRQKILNDWPVFYSKTTGYGHIYNEERVCRGYIVNKQGDTLKGRLKLVPYAEGTWPAIFWLPEGRYAATDIHAVPRTAIRSVRIFTDSLNDNLDGYWDLANLDNRELWRILAGKDSLIIYDDYTPIMRSSFGHEMILVKGGNQRIRIYRRYHAPDEQMSPEILAFINKQYNERHTVTDFAGSWSMIQYILEREAKGR